MLTGFFSALQFLTIIPLGAAVHGEQINLSRGRPYFPVIGLFLGLVLAATNVGLSLLLAQKLLVSVLLVSALAIITGGLHLDGLADTFDALGSGKERIRMLEIMRDAHIGTMGVLGIIFVVALKIALLYSLPAQDVGPALLLMCLLSRYVMVLAIFLFSYARDEGKAKAFFTGKSKKEFFSVTVFSLAGATIIGQLLGLAIFLLAALFAVLAARIIARKIGGLTGDTLGAINELTEVFVLFTMLVMEGSKG
ncbi:MAG: adenosylcobinamide-GDP ribazoletransferase [Candidatus Omnitrophota bacterium]